MRIFPKIVSFLIMIFSAWVAFYIGAAPLVEGKNIISPYADTHFAENYMPELFDDIKLGMSESEVIKLIGSPLDIRCKSSEKYVKIYEYTGDGKLWANRTAFDENYGDLAWYRSSLGFDKYDKVSFIDKGWSYD